jgi:hypothetical protein
LSQTGFALKLVKARYPSKLPHLTQSQEDRTSK